MMENAVRNIVPLELCYCCANNCDSDKEEDHDQMCPHCQRGFCDKHYQEHTDANCVYLQFNSVEYE